MPGLKQILLLNCDWLGLSVRFDSTDHWREPSDGHFFIGMDGTNVFEKRYIMFNAYNEKVATLLFKPKSKLLDRDCGLIEIANEWLYHGIGVLKVLDILQQCHRFEVTGISRLDLCVDFNPSPRQWETIQGLASGRCYVAGKRSGSGFWSVVNNALLAERYQGKKIPHCQSWGHKTTAVKWKLYFKSKELLDEYGGKLWGKPYIVDCWEDARLKRNDVWRLEVSIKDCNQLLFNDQLLTWDNWRHCNPRSLFRTLYAQRFSVRLNQHHRDKSNDEHIDFLPIDRLGTVRTKKNSEPKQRNSRITLLRHLISALDSDEILLDEESRENVLWHIGELVAANHLSNYFLIVTGKDIDTWTEDIRCQAYERRGKNAITV